MKKQVNLNQTVYEIVHEYPEIRDVLAGLGFSEIQNNAMLETAGRIMTLPKGAALKHIDLAGVIQTLKDHGFLVMNGQKESSGKEYEMDKEGLKNQPALSLSKNQELDHNNQKRSGLDNPAGDSPASRMALLKQYLKQLKSGEDLPSVQAEFVKNFQSVDAAEIMQAEQEMMAEGTSPLEVSRLCDLHSALFHGHTRAERIEQAERALSRSLQKQNEEKRKAGISRAQKLEEIHGHPLNIFSRENEALASLIEDYEKSQDHELLEKLRQLAVHYAKKGDLLYPLLKVKYDISGPHSVMWTVDDEIRDELARLVQAAPQKQDAEWQKQLIAVLKRAKEMIYKEQNILFPLTAQNFTLEDWKQIEQDSHQYPTVFDAEPGGWMDEETITLDDDNSFSKPEAAISEGLIAMPGGTMKLDQLIALLDTIPMEITFVDAKDINRYFNDGHEMKVFKRPKAALGREVYSCHPPKIEPMVRQIIQQFKEGSQNEVAVWLEKSGKPMYVRYMAVRSRTGRFLGTLELVQDMEFARKHFLDSRPDKAD